VEIGIAGIIAGFAVKDSLENIFGGVSLILDKTLKVGDRVELSDGTSGIVIDMSLRSTRIRVWDNESVIVPNGSLANSKIQNIGLLHSSVRCVVSFSVAYGADIDKVKKIVLKEIKGIKEVLKEPSPSVVFLDFGDIDLKLNANFWVDSPPKRYSTKLLVRELIYKALKKNKIKMGYQLVKYSIAKKK
jgi:MscS family membrane protein